MSEQVGSWLILGAGVILSVNFASTALIFISSKLPRLSHFGSPDAANSGVNRSSTPLPDGPLVISGRVFVHPSGALFAWRTTSKIVFTRR
jgi:hypothetical protein